MTPTSLLGQYLLVRNPLGLTPMLLHLRVYGNCDTLTCAALTCAAMLKYHTVGTPHDIPHCHGIQT